MVPRLHKIGSNLKKTLHWILASWIKTVLELVKSLEYAAVKLLIENGASVDIVDSNAGVVMTPLASAMLRKRSLELAELLLAKGASADGLPGEVPPVVMAGEMGNKAAIELLRRHGADLYRRSTATTPSQNALTSAAPARHTDMERQ